MLKIIGPVALLFALSFEVNGKPLLNHFGEALKNSIVEDVTKK